MIRVLVVDDSATVRRAISAALANQPGIEVVGTAPDPYVARDQVVALRPDVITLDLEMPRMDGLEFLARLMRHNPLPVIVISSLTPRGSDEALRALELGAVEVLCKPGSALSASALGPQLVRAVRAAALARPQARAAAPPAARPTGLLGRTTDKLVAIGASTGGTEAIRAVIEQLPADTPGTVIVQHMPPLFTAAFARRLDGCGALRVAEAQGGEELRPGQAWVAPGNRHLVVRRDGARYRLELRDGPAVHFQRPAVDVTFHSVAAAAGANAMGVLLTGMGRDGADGLLAMRRAGARTVAQDEASSVVWGMPKAAVECGAADSILPLGRVADAIVSRFTEVP